MADVNALLRKKLEEAVAHFWKTRDAQGTKQGEKSGKKDQGARAAVTGGAHMNGFLRLFRSLLTEAGLPQAQIFVDKQIELPGYFRAEKKWDLLIVVDECLIASIECKSHIGPSFGNNFNNRTEEALGNATDVLAAYREGAFKPSKKPWLGYLMLLEDCPESTAAVNVKEPHFKVFPEFRGASYVKRYEILMTRLLRERLYDSACLLLSNRAEGKRGQYREPDEELSFQKFSQSLLAQATACLKTGPSPC